METEEQMMKNYDRANRLRAWADLFGYQIEMGRDCLPYVIIDGVKNSSEDTESLLSHMADWMGMSEDYLNGIKKP